MGGHDLCSAMRALTRPLNLEIIRRHPLYLILRFSGGHDRGRLWSFFDRVFGYYWIFQVAIPAPFASLFGP